MVDIYWIIYFIQSNRLERIWMQFDLPLACNLDGTFFFSFFSFNFFSSFFFSFPPSGTFAILAIFSFPLFFLLLRFFRFRCPLLFQSSLLWFCLPLKPFQLSLFPFSRNFFLLSGRLSFCCSLFFTSSSAISAAVGKHPVSFGRCLAVAFPGKDTFSRVAMSLLMIALRSAVTLNISLLSVWPSICSRI